MSGLRNSGLALDRRNMRSWLDTLPEFLYTQIHDLHACIRPSVPPPRALSANRTEGAWTAAPLECPWHARDALDLPCRLGKCRSSTCLHDAAPCRQTTRHSIVRIRNSGDSQNDEYCKKDTSWGCSDLKWNP
jgi:hypothetical protein